MFGIVAGALFVTGLSFIAIQHVQSKKPQRPEEPSPYLVLFIVFLVSLVSLHWLSGMVDEKIGSRTSIGGGYDYEKALISGIKEECFVGPAPF